MSRRVKAAFFDVAGPFMTMNGWIWRNLRKRHVQRDVVRVQLGPGQANYLQGWVNIDANMFTAKCDIWADLRDLLPFPDNSVDAVYSYHVVEHLPNMWAHFRDVHRVLKPGGVYRVGGPHAESAMKKYLAGDHDWFPSFPDDRDSIGGRFVNFIFCRNEHLTMLTESYLQEIAKQAGFPEGVRKMHTRETGFPALFTDCLSIEHESDFENPHTILLEFQKAV
ncbi:MAG: methyltransferase domain-containing protein [Pseudomonadota bacterium]